MEEKVYTASRLSKGNFLFPASVIIGDREVTLKFPGFFSGKSRSIVYQQIEGVNVDEPMIGYSTITFVVGGEELVGHGFTKAEVEEIRQICSQKISAVAPHTQSGVIADAVSSAVGKAGSGAVISVADELKKLKELMDAGVINQAEFDQQKAKLLQ